MLIFSVVAFKPQRNYTKLTITRFLCPRQRTSLFLALIKHTPSLQFITSDKLVSQPRRRCHSLVVVRVNHPPLLFLRSCWFSPERDKECSQYSREYGKLFQLSLERSTRECKCDERDESSIFNTTDIRYVYLNIHLFRANSLRAGSFKIEFT